MKTIIIELPEDLSAESVCYAVASVANEIGSGTLTITPPFCHAINADGIRVTVRSEAEPDNQAHPPLNTPLSAFTPAMLDALPVGSRFGPTSEFGHVVTKRDDGVWCGEMVSPFEEDSANLLRFWGDDDPPLTLNPTRVGPEQASESALTPEMMRALDRFNAHVEAHHGGPVGKSAPSATLPDPWPGMIVDVDADDGNRYRATIAFVRSFGERTWIGFTAMGAKDARWNDDHIHEVRTPDGVTVWKRPAAKVTTEPRALSTYTHDEILAFPVGTSVGAYRLYEVGWIARIPGVEWSPDAGPHTPSGFVVGVAPSLAGCVVHIPKWVGSAGPCMAEDYTGQKGGDS